MSLDRFIKWDKIWNEEVCIDSHDLCGKKKELINMFKDDSDVELFEDECYVLSNSNLVFNWSCIFGQNESDSQGSFVSYDITIDKDFFIIDINYEQG